MNVDIKDPLQLNNYELKKAGMVYRAIRHKKRQDIIKYLDCKGASTVNELSEVFRSGQPDISYHIGILKDANLVRGSRKWKYIFYSVNYEMLEKVRIITDGLF